MSAQVLDAARQVADAVMYEGYVLFPYRASALKNRYRWQWGVVIPQAQVDIGGSEPATVHSEVLVRAEPGTVVDVTARFLHLRLRQLHDADGAMVDELEVDGEPVPTWEEGLEREVTLAVTLGRQDAATQAFAYEGEQTTQALGSVGTAVRTVQPVSGRVQVDVDAAGHEVWKLRTAVVNTTAWSQPRAPREDVLRRSIVGAHTMLHVRDGAFASAIDPPDWAPAEFEPSNRGLHPVLVGDDDTVVLSAPIILYDHPAIAPESPGPSFDATEVDELLALAVLGLSDDEKRRARATDARAAELIDRTDTLPAAVQERLHGRVRELRPADLRPAPEVEVSDEVRTLLGVGEEPVREAMVGGAAVTVGARVRLRPRRRADAHDLFSDGRVALVEKIVRTDDEQVYLAVTLEDDPAAELHRWYGRFQYFGIDEVEPLLVADHASSTPAADVAADHASDEGG